MSPPECIIVLLPDFTSLEAVAHQIANLIEEGTVRVVDLVVVARTETGEIQVFELEELDALSSLAGVEGQVGGMLSEQDIALASTAMSVHDTGLVMVIERRWIDPFLSAVELAGGTVVFGGPIHESATNSGPGDWTG